MICELSDDKGKFGIKQKNMGHDWHNINYAMFKAIFFFPFDIWFQVKYGVDFVLFFLSIGAECLYRSHM